MRIVDEMVAAFYEMFPFLSNFFDQNEVLGTEVKKASLYLLNLKKCNGQTRIFLLDEKGNEVANCNGYRYGNGGE